MTQGAILAEQLKRRPHTLGDMLEYRVSTSPWKRVKEWLDRHGVGWKLVKGRKSVGIDTLVTWRIVKND